MKTAFLIPLILLELNESDKYGIELTKSIETRSEGKIIIKQPTLYTILKKLEKSKFISSYWEDSDIGGKRHYYKITDNGKMQVSTLPSYEELIKNAVADDDADSFTAQNAEQKISQQSNDTQRQVSIMDSIMIDSTPDAQIEPVESILPTDEVFASKDDIDTLTETEINKANADILKNEKINKEEAFADNKDVSKFTELGTTTLSNDYKQQFISPSSTSETNSQQEASYSYTQDLPNPEKFDIATNEQYDDYKKVKYVDYVNYKTNPNYIYSKTMTKNIQYKALCTSAFIFVMLLISAIIVNFVTHTSALYYVFMLTALAVMIFYPAIVAFRYDKIKESLQTKKYNPDLKKQFYISLVIELAILVIIFIVNINIGNNSISLIFRFSNFANFYAPILFSLAMFADILFSYIFLEKRQNRR